ncbi:6-pyruvoyl trahydropterin synthase family protein [Thioflexithrix psekupsensis]|uniref:6-carboxy-5,6,7,8-tetrahydropterin synthase n=1 Tax=Thioflexithrix psekupsensis TaxID=1570016 RepID=A0A251X6Y3_9GAMM|nr:6-carboxytetrahydropterin synthase [Thioflexithrix psekupsensis]OUD13144.1 hypothetical protein TPSD3_10905 [Thioflexithrix psekupsensis]
MYSIITKVTYEYAHRLMYHQGKCRHVHGHSGEVTVELTASVLNENGFVMDFNDIKTPLKQWINEHWDHAYLANRHDPLLPTLQANGMKIFIFDAEPSAEVMAAFLYWKINDFITRPEVRVKRVTVRETCTGSASYEPEHH